MTINRNLTNQRGFGIRGLLAGIAAIALLANYFSPELDTISRGIEHKAAETKNNIDTNLKPKYLHRLPH